MNQILGILAVVFILSGCGKTDSSGHSAKWDDDSSVPGYTGGATGTSGSSNPSLTNSGAESGGGACGKISYAPISIYIVQSSGIVKVYPDPNKGPGTDIKIVQSSTIVKIGVNPHQPVRLKVVQSSAIVSTVGVCVVN